MPRTFISPSSMARTGFIFRMPPAMAAVLESLPLEVYKGYSELFDEDLYTDIDLETCVKKRISEGGTSPSSTDAQIAYVEEVLNNG